MTLYFITYGKRGIHDNTGVYKYLNMVIDTHPVDWIKRVVESQKDLKHDWEKADYVLMFYQELHPAFKIEDYDCFD